MIVGQWKERGHFRQSRASHQSIVVGDYVYVLGGYARAHRAGAVAFFNDVQYANLNELCNGSISDRTWQRTIPFQRARSGHACIAHNGRIYIIGGSDGINYFSDVQYAAISDDGVIQSSGWLKSENELNCPRSAHGCGFYENSGKVFIYVAGGAGLEDGKTVHYNSVEYAPIHSDGTIGKWSLSKSRFCEGRAHCGVAIIHDHLYIIGGWGHYDLYADLQNAPILADGSLGEWKTNRATLNFARYGHSTIICNDAQTLLVIGGVIVTGASDVRPELIPDQLRESHEKRIATGRGRLFHGQSQHLGDMQYSIIELAGTSPWIPLSADFDIVPKRWGHTCIIYGNRLLVMGGQSNADGFLSDVLMAKIDPNLS